MLKPLIAALAAAALLLALPAASLAQSAGDNQYQDPLGGNSGSSGSSGGGNSGSNGSSGQTQAPSSSPAPAPAQPAQAAAPATASKSSASSTKELPRTGGDPLMVVLLGSGLLLAGGGLRLAIPRRTP